jgi:hypothetical protein
MRMVSDTSVRRGLHHPKIRFFIQFALITIMGLATISIATVLSADFSSPQSIASLTQTVTISLNDGVDGTFPD